VKRSKAAGSLRRRRPLVADLEFVAEPFATEDLFGASRPDVERIRRALLEWGEMTKAGERFIQIQHVMKSQLNLDLFLVHPPASFAVILATRTGPASLGKLAVTRMRERGCRCEDGRLIRERTREVIPTPDEEAFFRCAGLPCVPPPQRDSAAAFLTDEAP
jgi:DNA polymerase/3'-5' exonuclease PolX